MQSQSWSREPPAERNNHGGDIIMQRHTEAFGLEGCCRQCVRQSPHVSGFVPATNIFGAGEKPTGHSNERRVIHMAAIDGWERCVKTDLARLLFEQHDRFIAMS